MCTECEPTLTLFNKIPQDTQHRKALESDLCIDKFVLDDVIETSVKHVVDKDLYVCGADYMGLENVEKACDDDLKQGRGALKVEHFRSDAAKDFVMVHHDQRNHFTLWHFAFSRKTKTASARCFDTMSSHFPREDHHKDFGRIDFFIFHFAGAPRIGLRTACGRHTSAPTDRH